MIEAALIGAGSRGRDAYAAYALKNPHEIKFIAVAEPNDEKRLKFAMEHGIKKEMQFESWEEFFNQSKICEAVLICTQDAQHFEPTMMALKKGYNILLEKPMSPSPKETLMMAEEAERLEAVLSVCHVMRYSTYFSTLKEILGQNKIGKLINVQWNENIGYWHFAHSFVRGNWRNSDLSSPMILQKCCHDMDMLQWLINSECVKVTSFGGLSYFTKENAPEGSTARCIDCAVENSCSFSAIKLYFNEKNDWPQNVVSLENTLSARMEALKEGPYGRCVFQCDNNVADHQVVNLLFENEVTVSFNISAFTKDISRTFKLMGTEGEIRGHYEKNEIEIIYFSGKREVINPELVEGGHGGSDTMIMKDFIQRIKNDSKENLTSSLISAKSHLIAFAAEESRITGESIVMKEYIKNLSDEKVSEKS